MLSTVRPKIKANKPYYPLNGKIYVHGCGTVTAIADPNGVILRLFKLADGSRTCAEINEAMSVDFPTISLAEIADWVSQLDKAGFVENGSHTAEGVLDPYTVERWTRNLSFFEGYSNLRTSKYDLQRRLQQSRVVLLGAGGVGSHILFGLAAMGVEDLRIVDFDSIELSNLNRQILYTEADIGRAKAEAAAERIRAFNPRVRVDAVQERIGSAADVRRLVADRDIAISVVDRPTMHITSWVNEGCVTADVPFVTGGLETQRAVFYSVLPGISGCGLCWQQQLIDNDPASAELMHERRRVDFSAANAAFGPLVTTISGFILAEFARIVTGIAPPIGVDHLLQIRFDDFALSEAERWTRHPDCPACQALAQSKQQPDLTGSSLSGGSLANTLERIR
jgi:molybdopterin/thiamine biosynthesis adenylyltransferase